MSSLADARPEVSDWPADSTRTVAGLAAREQRAVQERMTGAGFAATLTGTRPASSLLEELGWSARRFSSVGAALGFAAAANDLPDERELRRLQREAARQLAPLADDHRVFITLTAADAAAVRRRAAWIPRSGLLDALLNVPIENRRFARVHADKLAAVLPAGFDRTALDRLLSDRERSAVPFHEPVPDRDDALLRWNGAAVIVAEEGGTKRRLPAP